MISGMDPFCHFFDHHFLHQFNLTHEVLGQHIIRDHLAPIIKKIRRSPSGPFAPGEQLDPEHIAFLILKDPHKSTKGLPPWVIALQPLLGGIYTPDNCDYVLRDSYMCGVAIGPVDIERLLHYTFFSSHGLTIHQSGLPALQMFLHAQTLSLCQRLLPSHHTGDRHSSSGNFSTHHGDPVQKKPSPILTSLPTS